MGQTIAENKKPEQTIASRTLTNRAERYDPEKELGDFIIEAEKFRKRSSIPLKDVTKDGKVTKKAGEVTGYVCLLKRSRKTTERFKVVRKFVKNREEYIKLLDSEEYANSRLLECIPHAELNRTGLPKAREAFQSFLADGYGDGPGGQRTVGVNNEFTPLLSGPYSKQLYIHDYLEMHSKCFEVKNHNPLAKQIVDVVTNYVVGKGVKIAFNNKDCQKYWDAFAKRNKFTQKNKTDNDGLTWQGEIMLWKRVINGRPVIDQIDPSTVWEIITEPTDIEKVFYYHQQYPTQFQILYGAPITSSIASKYVINDIPGHEVIHKKINSTPGEKRGRSDLFPILGWLKRFKDYYNAKVIKAQIEESFAMVKTVKGSQEDVTALANDSDMTELAPPGSIIIENESITTSYLTPTTSSSGSARDNVGEAIRSICATGVGLTPEFLGVSGAATQATAITKAEPTYKKIDSRQQLNEELITEEAEWVTDVGIGLGDIPKTQVRDASLASIKKAIIERNWKEVVAEAWSMLRGKQLEEPIDKGFEITHPEILSEDRSAKLKDINNVYLMGAFTHERASTMASKEMGVTNYDYEDEMEKRQQEDGAKIMEMYGQGGIPFSGMGAQPEDDAQPGSSLKKAVYKGQAKDKTGAA